MNKLPKIYGDGDADFKKFERSVSESSSPNMIAVPNLNDFDDPESKEEALMDYLKRLKASRQPIWLPGPKTASESFLHEIPGEGVIEVKPWDGYPLHSMECCYRLSQFYNHQQDEGKRKTGIEKAIAQANELADVIDVSLQSKRSKREVRRRDAEDFRKSFLNKCTDQKTCIGSSCYYGGYCSWLDEKSFGVMWVGVHGINTVCVVTGRSAMVGKSVVDKGGNMYTDIVHVSQLFRETLISEMEDLVDSSSSKSSKELEPFAVVSIPAGTKAIEESGHEVTNKAIEERGGQEASGAVFDGRRAIDFITEKMGSGSTFGYSDTLQTAVSAYLLLFDKELKAEDVRVCVLTKRNYCPMHLLIRDEGENLVVRYPSGIQTLVERPPRDEVERLPVLIS